MREMTMNSPIMFVIGIFLGCGFITAAEQPRDLLLRAKGICLDVERTVNDVLLKKPESVKCIPGGGQLNGSVSLMLVYQLPWLSSSQSKKACLVASMLAVGSVLRNNPSVRVEDIVVSDIEQMKNLKAYKFPAEAAIRIQRQVQSDKIDWEVGYNELTKVLQQIKIPLPH